MSSGTASHPHIDLDRESRRFLELAQDLVCIAGTDGFFKYVNSAWQEVLGFSEQELMSKPFVEFVHPRDRERTRLESQALAEGAKTINFDNRYITRGGDYRHLEWTALADLDRGLIYAMARDVTDARLTAQALKDFAHVVSHDLKAPLRGIRQLANFLSEDYRHLLDEAGQDMVDMLQARTLRMDQLIDGILEHSRIGRINAEKVDIEIGQLLREIVDSLAPPNHIQIRLKEPFPTVRLQPTYALQVFQNLIGNAIQYCDKPEGEVVVSCDVDTDCYHFVISDNGRGIAECDRERIFGIFETVGEQGGTGVGLAVVKKIVEYHAGRVWVESTSGQGSAFHFTIPRLGESPT